MSSIQSDLGNFSQALIALVNQTAHGVVAVKSAAYRVTSGVVLANNLVAVTSHSLRREDRIPVHAGDGAEAGATVLGRDPGLDLAILRTEGLNPQVLPAADPSTLKAGMLAAVVGRTVDVGPTVSLGVLGAVGPSRKNWRGGTLDQFLRLDVNVYPSQSGAAVVNTEGQLIGMATPALSRHSTLAIPMASIERIARELLEQGRILHGYLGVGAQPVAVAKMNTAQETGLILLSVEADSPAEKAGLLLGDVLLTLDGKPMADIDDLHAALRGDVVGKSVKAAVLRGGKLVETEILVLERGARK
ncbi:MAG: S1C family serine protease [Acidobacteriota bacterium]|nr:S1C family serine protease [Acidobacteriota bacterium]